MTRQGVEIRQGVPKAVEDGAAPGAHRRREIPHEENGQRVERAAQQLARPSPSLREQRRIINLLQSGHFLRQVIGHHRLHPISNRLRGGRGEGGGRGGGTILDGGGERLEEKEAYTRLYPHQKS